MGWPVRKQLTNDFSWSKSRHEKLADCPRAYYFQYYQSWGGWEPTAPRRARELYVLKKLSNRYTWAGGIVHLAIRGALMAIKNGRALDPARVINRVHKVMQEDFVFSRSRAYWRDRHRKEFSGLVEHEYDEPVPRELWKTNWDTVHGALSWFFSSRWPAFARSLKQEQWLEVDLMDFEKSIFHLEGVKIFAVPDFAYLDHDGAPVVVDWKTGRAREGYDAQVIGYALYLAARYKLPIEKMRTCLVYLNDGVERLGEIDPPALQRFHQHFAQSIETMRGFLVDPRSNDPLPEHAFRMTEDLTACARCVFRRPCGRQGAPQSMPALRASG